MILSGHRWMALLLIGSVTTLQGASESARSGRNLNPYHEQQLQNQINKCASGVLACSDAETRCLKQQELCQLLMRGERYDEALQVAYNVFQTDSTDKERCAAHHYLLAEIYNRKMRASATADEMEQNRQFALSAAQEVVDKKYPSKWGVSDHARALIHQLSDQKNMAQVRQRVTSRQGTGDVAKQAIAEAQRKYLDATQGKAQGNIENTRPPANFMRVTPEAKQDKAAVIPRAANPPSVKEMQLPASPVVTRTVSPQRSNTAMDMVAESPLNQSGLLTSQPGTAVKSHGEAGRQPVMVNGVAAQSASTVDAVMQNNLAQLLESARKRKENTRRSPYATGELPSANQ